MPSKTKTPTAPNGFDVEKIATTGQQSLAAMAHLHSRVFRDAMKFNAELLDFARRRIDAEIEASDRLCRCDSVAGAMEVASDFCRKAYRDYAEGATSLMRLGTSVGAKNAEETLAEASKVTGSAGDRPA